MGIVKYTSYEMEYLQLRLRLLVPECREKGKIVRV